MSASDRVDGFYRLTLKRGRGVGYRRLMDNGIEHWSILQLTPHYRTGIAFMSEGDLPDEAIGERIE